MLSSYKKKTQKFAVSEKNSININEINTDTAKKQQN